MKIEYIRVNKDGWKEVKDSALTTIHKFYTDSEVTEQWKCDILLSEHSPIRELIIRAKFTEIPRWIADQLVRHNIGFTPYMGTMRTDRGNKPRNEQRMTDLTELKFTANAQSIINISQDRLCIGKVSKETRKLWELFLSLLNELQPELVTCCVPSCVYRFGCKEFKSCGYFEKFKNSDPVISDMSILDRYYMYYLLKED